MTTVEAPVTRQTTIPTGTLVSTPLDTANLPAHDPENLSSWSLDRLVNFVASDSVSTASRLELAPAVMREIAARMRSASGLDNRVLKNSYREIVTLDDGEFAKEEALLVKHLKGDPRCRLTVASEFGIMISPPERIQDSIANILELVAERIEDGRVTDAGRYCYVSDEAGIALKTGQA